MRFKYYLADAAIGPAILMKGKTVLEDAHALSTCVETTVMAHLSVHSNINQAQFSYWRNSREKEVDMIVEQVLSSNPSPSGLGQGSCYRGEESLLWRISSARGGVLQRRSRATCLGSGF